MQKLLKQFYQTSVTCCELKGDKDLTFPPFFLDQHACEISVESGEKCFVTASEDLAWCRVGLCVQCHMHNDLHKSEQLKYFTSTVTSTCIWNYLVWWRILDHLAGKFFSFSCGFVAKLTPNKWWRGAVTLLSWWTSMATLLQKGSTLKLSGFKKYSAGVESIKHLCVILVKAKQHKKTKLEWCWMFSVWYFGQFGIQSLGFRFCSVGVDNRYHSSRNKLQLSYSDS